MTAQDNSLLQGSLDMLVLRSLVGGAKHGYGVARHIHVASDEALRIEEGSLYPALHRLERRGWVESEWGVSESNRRAKYYRLTRSGRSQLKAQTAAWEAAVAAVTKVLAAECRGGLA
ncbi:MAG: PadR family transcriptional regulator [Planctomycetales bacterium]|nr:PadR family transcriptional regulator [Planctomycetales bacterium]